MKTLEINTMTELQQWLAQYKIGQQQFAFRGQADKAWPLRTSLARHFLENHVDKHQWRKRECKMYCAFRKQLLNACHDLYEKLDAPDILSLMQHHHAPTRLLDFSYDPKIAAYFALVDSRGDSAIWVIDSLFLEKRRKEKRLPKYCGPTHDPKCSIFRKDSEGKYRLVGSVLSPDQSHARLAAQRGCFFCPGSISKIYDETIEKEFVYAKVTLSKSLGVEALDHFAKQGCDHDNLFPDLDKLAKKAKRLSVIEGPDCTCAGVVKAK